MKRKPDVILGAAQQYKRGRHTDTDGGDTFDIDGTAQGAKHWTDEEKTRLFTWLMGQGQDEHWNSLRATKNSCLREVCDIIYHLRLEFTYNMDYSARQRYLAARRHTKH